MQEIVVITENNTPRLRYTAELIFKTILGCNLSIVAKKEYSTEKEKIVINYSQNIERDCFNIPNNGLLYEQGIRHLIPDVIQQNNLPIIFHNGDPQGFDIEFDVFSAVFYFITRYEEYCVASKDLHDRIDVSQLLAVKNNFYHLPIVHLWCNVLVEKLKSKFPQLEVIQPTFKYVPTVDIDNAYAFKGKGFWRQITGIANSLLRFQFESIIKRFLVLSGNRKDSYDTYAFLQEIHAKYKFNAKYFFLVGESGKYDRNLNPKKVGLRSLIKRIDEKNQIGLHPSYASYLKPKIIKFEKERLENIVGEVTTSRQHFLRLKLPETYQILEKLGVNEDYTMGIANRIGFRSGLAVPHKFYDISQERILNITVYPFQVMDVTLQQYMELNPEQALEEIKKIIEQVYAVGGTFISLWHNESLSEWQQWKGWRIVYEQMLEYVNDKISTT